MKKIYMFALIMAVASGVAVYLFAESLKIRSSENIEDMADVVVALVNIPSDTIITSDMVGSVTLPSQAIHPQAQTSLSNVIGKINQYPIVANEQILSFRIQEKSQDNKRLSYSLEPGYRAITIGVDNITGVAGYISQGDHVDLIINTTVDETNISKYQVENLLVMRIGANSVSPDQPLQYGSITLAATPEQILKINHGINNGRMTFVLRPITDDEILDPEEYYEGDQ